MFSFRVFFLNIGTRYLRLRLIILILLVLACSPGILSAGRYLDSLSWAVELLSGKDQVDAMQKLVEAYRNVSLDTAKMLCRENTMHAFDINYRIGQYNSRMQYARLLAEENQISEATLIFEEVRNNFYMAEYKTGAAESYIAEGVMYIQANRVKDAYQCYKSARGLIESIKNKALQAKLKALLALVNKSWQNAPVDQREAVNAIADAESSGDFELAMKCRFLLGECYFSNKQLIDALQTYSGIVSKTHTMNNPYYNIYSNFKMALVYFDLEMLDSSYFYAAYCLKRAAEEGISNIEGYAYQLLGKIIGRSGNFQKRMEFTRQAMACWTRNGNKMLICEAYADMAEYYFDNGNVEGALYSAQSGMPIAIQANNLKVLRQLNFLLYQIFDKKQEIETAFNYLLRYREYSDTINDLEGRRQLNKYQEKIAEEKQEKQLAQARIVRQKVFIYGLSALFGLSVLIIIAMLLYNRKWKRIYIKLLEQSKYLDGMLNDLRESQRQLDEMNEELKLAINEKNNHLTLEYNERVFSESLLKESEEKYRRVVDNIHDGVFILQDDRFYYVNEAFCKITGYTLLEMIRMNLHSIVKEKDAPIAEKFLEADENSGFIYFNIVHKNGSPINLIGRRAKRLNIESKSSTICTVTDITEFKKAQKELEESVAEKETLVKEIHHRVKNNLQIVSSLINMQSRTISDPVAKNIFFEALNRIKSIALIHERLYRTENLSKIHSNDYISAIAFSTLYSFRDKAENFELDIKTDNVMIEIEKAIPIALLINEIISNSVKSYKVSDKVINMCIKFSNLGEGLCSIIYTDDGEGLNDKYEFSDTNPFGFRLIKILASQLYGEVRYHQSTGTKVEILVRV